MKASYIQSVMDQFSVKTEELDGQMNEIAHTISVITNAIDESAKGITSVSEGSQSIVLEMNKINENIDQTREIMEELREQTKGFNE